VLPHSTAPKHRGRYSPQKTRDSHILPVCLDLKKIAKSARNYCWPRPLSCRCGNPTVWGHGYVLVCFTGFSHPLEIRRYRCPLCGCVIRLRPKGYFPRIQTDEATVQRILDFRIATGFWPPGAITNRCRHWLAALKKNTIVILGIAWQKDLMVAFNALKRMGRIPIRRTI
jgi:hypothetical protein